eukprot:1145118-Pelagomonas_calceolata.AAC.1
MGSKSCEPPSPDGKREASVGLVGFWQHVATGHQTVNMAVLAFNVWSCLDGVVLLLISSLRLILQNTRCEGGRRWSIWVSKARSDHNSVKAAGGASSLIRNTGSNEVLRYYTIRGLLGQTVYATYIHMCKI